jgi:hypothetical protein
MAKIKINENVNLKPDKVKLNNHFDPKAQKQLDALSEALKYSFTRFDDPNKEDFGLLEAYASVFQKVSFSKAKIIYFKYSKQFYL